MKQEQNELIKEYKLLPQLIWDTQMALIQAQQELEDAFDDLECLKATINLEISTKKDDDGKNLYTNEKMRESACKQALCTSSPFNEMNNRYRFAKMKIANIGADLERWKNKLKVYTHSIDYLASVSGQEK